ncbi:MAG: IPT/TIG domain-containing protein [Bacteroidota bacterium]
MNSSTLILLRFVGLCFLLILLFQSCAEVFELPAPQPPPRITSMSPDSGTANQVVVITGVNFSTDLSSNAVKFNGKFATVTKASATELTVQVPAHAGSGNVEVIVKKKATNGPIFTFFETPIIASISPNRGLAGTVVTLKGKYFDTTATNNTVRFGDKLATVQSPASDTLLQVSVPADAISGAVTVTVNGITGIGPQFTVISSQEPILTITSISPTTGTTGTVVTINGDNFATTVAANQVKFNGKAATVTSASLTQLKVTVPAFAGTGLVSVTVNDKTANYSQFTYVWPTPVITSITPTSGGPATVVTITGNNFFDGVAANNQVKFNGKVAVVNSATLTQLKAVVPEGAGTGIVSVTVQGSTGNGPTFTYIDTAAPTITNYDPNQGFVGDVVAIVGTNFSPTTAGNAVKFNGTTATVTSATATLLKVTIPVGATTGAISVTVNGKTATGASFTVLNNNPTIISFTPASGSVGMGVTITGTNFGSDPAAIEIKFNGVLASPQQITPTSIVTVVPQGATTGKITVTVNGKTGTSVLDFTVTTGAPGSFSATGGMTYGRYSHTATLLADGRVLVAGGSGNDQANAPCEIYDPATGNWTITGSLKTPRMEHKAFRLKNGKVLIIGGSSGREVANMCELYDPATGQWTDAGSLSVLATSGSNNIYRGAGFRAVMLANGSILATGGGGYSQNSTRAEVYDQATGKWTLTGEMAYAERILHTNTLLKNGKVLVAGYTTNTTLFDPTTNTWTDTGGTSPHQTNATAALLPNGKVLFAGGSSIAGVVDSCKLFDPATGLWTVTGSMQKKRTRLESVVLLNGKVLVVGGQGDQSEQHAGCEIYDPATGKWTPTGSTDPARVLHTLTLLPNGQVLIAGGINFRASGYRQCELYTP